MNQYRGRQWAMMSRHLWTKASAVSRSLGVLALVRAMLYCVHGGEHQMTSGGSRLKSVYSQVNKSWHTSAPHLGSLSKDITSCPAARHGRPTLPVPLHISQIRMCFLFQVVWFQMNWPRVCSDESWGCLSSQTQLPHSIDWSKHLVFRPLSVAQRHRRASAKSYCPFS